MPRLRAPESRRELTQELGRIRDRWDTEIDAAGGQHDGSQASLLRDALSDLLNLTVAFRVADDLDTAAAEGADHLGGLVDRIGEFRRWPLQQCELLESAAAHQHAQHLRDAQLWARVAREPSSAAVRQIAHARAGRSFSRARETRARDMVPDETRDPVGHARWHADIQHDARARYHEHQARQGAQPPRQVVPPAPVPPIAIPQPAQPVFWTLQCVPGVGALLR